MVCKCSHPIRDHDWALEINKLEPCNRCNCKTYKEETSERKLKKFIKKGIW